MPPDEIVELECQRLVSDEKGNRSHSQNTMSGTSARTQRRRAIHHESSVTRHAAVREGVAGARVQRASIEVAHVAGHHRLLEDGGLDDDPAVGIDNPADAGVGRRTR